MSIHHLALVETSEIATDVQVDAFAIVRTGAVIGSGVRIHSHALIEGGVTVGDGVEIFSGAVLGRCPKGAGAISRSPAFVPSVHIGRDCSVGANAVIYYDVAIGSNTLIGDGSSIREGARIGSRCIISRQVTLNYNVTVGDRTKVMDLAHLTGDMSIAEDVFISAGVLSANDNKLGRMGYSPQVVRGPTIERGAVIGAGAILLPSVVIGEGATVAAGAVVTKNVQAHTLVMGMPAREVPPRT